MDPLAAETPRAHSEQLRFRDQVVGPGRSRDGGFPGRPDGRVRAARTDGKRRGTGHGGYPAVAAIAARRPATRRAPSVGWVQSLGADNLDRPGSEIIPAGCGIFRILLRERLWRIDCPLFLATARD
jgi:hypothetical protein